MEHSSATKHVKDGGGGGGGEKEDREPKMFRLLPAESKMA